MIAVIDTGAGNFGSILNMLKKLKTPAVSTARADDIRAADKIILPGVGAFANGMAALKASGLIPILEEEVIRGRKPLLGICLGMQLLFEHSEEGDARGLGWIEGKVARFHFDEGARSLKVPHMGWNYLVPQAESPLLAGMDRGSRFYFTHSYRAECARRENVLALTDYGVRFVSAVISGNIAGVQFHPEKSHNYGLRLLGNFVRRF